MRLPTVALVLTLLCVLAAGGMGRVFAQEPEPVPAVEPTTKPQNEPEAKSEPPAAEEPAPTPSEPVEVEEPQKKTRKQLPRIGSANSPQLPGQPWRVHDINRPRPLVISPPAGEVITPPPGDAVILFDGTSLNGWAHRDNVDPALLYEPEWSVKEGYFEVTRGTGSLYTLENFGDVQLHIEWAEPEDVRGSSQGRGNSGIKFLGLYEIQILDSHQNLTYADGQAAAVYGQYPPDVNVSRKPGEWQTYDIIFETPKFEDSKPISPGYMTVLHNGVLVHHRRELSGVTGLRSPGKYVAHPPGGPIMLQDHGDPVRFRNIWARHLK